MATNSRKRKTALVIGGGFYGASIAGYLSEHYKIDEVTLVEKEDSLLSRASYSNQARVHNGYHYPRSFTTAYRSRINLPSFLDIWGDAVKQDFIKLYAIANRNSKVTSKQFVRFCKDIGARCEPATAEHQNLFNSSLISSVYKVQEFAFDATVIRDSLVHNLRKQCVNILTGATVKQIAEASGRKIKVSISTSKKDEEHLTTDLVFNCTYSCLNHVMGREQFGKAELKQEITEMALVDLPEKLKSIGVTVMDGPFYSAMPFPSRNLHTLSHVRYTPHLHWEDEIGTNPYERLESYSKESRFEWMLRDASRYMPAISEAKYEDSLFEVKTVLKKNETDDGRPILFNKHHSIPGLVSILGGKIDNIFDVIAKLEAELASI